MLTSAVLVFLLGYCQCYKFLVISPLRSKSHAILGNGVVKNLLHAGHEVTYVTFHPKSISHENVTFVDVSSELYLKAPSIKAILDKEINYQDKSFLLPYFLELARMTVSNENVQNLLKDKTQHFDAVIAEWMFNELYAGFSAIYECPLIWLSTVEPHWMVLQLIDEAPSPAYLPDIHTSYVPPFTFWQRLSQLAHQLYTHYLQYRYIYGKELEYYDRFLVPHIRNRGKTTPPLNVLRYNASLVLGNSHNSVGQAISLPQNYIQIGGYHIDDGVKILPESLKKIMDDANNGVIYFSLGSTLNTKDFPDDLMMGFLKIFGELKQTVIWKMEKDIKDIPKNVQILKWAPQQSVLAHPNCVLFITHGGLLSMTEAVHFGVPLVGIPLFADQYLNMAIAEKKGFAKKVLLSYSMLQEFKDKIIEVLENPKYATKAKETSMIYHSRLVPPGRALVQWTELAVRTRGAAHLRSPALRTAAHHKLYLDLLAAAALLLAAALYLIKILLKKCCQKSPIDANKKDC